MYKQLTNIACLLLLIFQPSFSFFPVFCLQLQVDVFNVQLYNLNYLFLRLVHYNITNYVSYVSKVSQALFSNQANISKLIHFEFLLLKLIQCTVGVSRYELPENYRTSNLRVSHFCKIFLEIRGNIDSYKCSTELHFPTRHCCSHCPSMGYFTQFYNTIITCFLNYYFI